MKLMNKSHHFQLGLIFAHLTL